LPLEMEKSTLLENAYLMRFFPVLLSLDGTYV
jgi:hypothetical protein